MKIKYSIFLLLKNQPLKLKKTADFKNIVSLYNNSPLLKKVFFNRKCYSILNNAKIIPDKLKEFYRKYKLPQHSLFPLFLKLKKEFLTAAIKKKTEKEKLILTLMRTLPLNIQDFIKNCGKFEKKISNNKKCTVWNTVIYPKSKRKVFQYKNYNTSDWLELINKYILLLQKKYKNSDLEYLKRLSSLFLLELPDGDYTIEELKKKYRILSKKYHPDLGGEKGYFNRVNSAYDYLVKNKKK